MRKPVLLIMLSMFLLMACEGELDSNLVTTSDLMTPTGIVPTPVDALPPEEEPAVGEPTTIMSEVTPASEIIEPAPADGTTATEIEAVLVETTCDIEISIDLAGYANLEDEMGCPLGPAAFDPIAVNEFGPGPDFDRFMLWFSTDQLIYVLLPDSQWRTYPDIWTEDMPLFACNPMQEEPTSPPLPRRGFGKVWCEDEEVRQQLGLIIREERLCQHAALQPFEHGRMLACYEDDTVRYFMLLNDKTWRVDFVQY